MKKGWKANSEIIRLFQNVGRASLLVDLQDSHSGNMSLLITDEDGAERIAITATGSQKGDLEPHQICFLSPGETDYGYYKASSETDIHAGILTQSGVRATFHAHTKELVIATLDDADKPNQPQPFQPIDPLGYYHLGGEVPVDWLSVPSGSIEMTKRVQERMRHHRATIVQGHGTFAKGRTLEEAFFLVAVANNSGYVVRLCGMLGVNAGEVRARIAADSDACFQFRPPDYTINDNTVCDFPQETEILAEFRKAGARIFESKLSPFHTGSISVRGVKTMLYAPKASMPRDIGGPLVEVPLQAEEAVDPEVRVHRAIYSGSDFQTVMHCYVPEAEVMAHFTYPGASEPLSRVVPVDAEGSFLYLVIPVVPPKVGAAELIDLLHSYKVAIVRGGGVWAVGQQSISEVLHHPSSVREICLYRLGAHERGLDVRKMEPKKAMKW